MGGMQYFWRVTLLNGEGEQGTFMLEEYSLALGEGRPRSIPYDRKFYDLNYGQLLQEIHNSKTHLEQEVLKLTPSKPQTELYYDWYMPI